MAPTASRTLLPNVMSLIAGVLLAPGLTHAQVRVEAASDSIRGRAPVVVFRPLENLTAPGQPPTPGHALRVEADASDPDGDVVGAVTYRWLRNGVELATGASYVPVAEDAGRTLVVEATAETDASTTDPAIGTATFDVPIAANSAPTVLATTITGVWRAGETLTAAYDYDDADNDPEDLAGREVQWFVSHPGTGAPVAVPGATGLTFTLRGEDAGANRTVWFNVEKVRSLTGTPNETTRPVGGAVGVWFARRTGLVEGRPPTMTTPTINGTVAVGQTLTGVPAGYADPDNDAEGTHTYKWYRADDATGEANKTLVTGATATTYAVPAADQGKYLVFEVTPVSQTGTPNTGEPVSRTTATAVPGTAPVMTNLRIEGTRATVGSTVRLEYDFADAEGDPDASTFDWCRRNVTCGLGTAREYVIQAADAGHQLNAYVTPRTSTGTPNVAPRQEPPPWPASGTIVVEAAPTATPVTIAGTATVGQTLTGNYTYADANGDPEGATTFQWYRANNPAGTGKTPIGGATGNTYAAVVADRNMYLVFEVTPKSATGMPDIGAAASAVTPVPVSGTLPTATMSWGMMGVTLMRESEWPSLWANVTQSDPDGDPLGTPSYQWYRVASDGTATAIPGATGHSYTIAYSAQNYDVLFEVRVTPRSANGDVGPVLTSRYSTYFGMRVTGSTGILTPPGGSLPMTLPPGLGSKRVAEINFFGETTWNPSLSNQSYTVMRGSTALCRYDRTVGWMGGIQAGFTECSTTGVLAAEPWSLRGEFTGGNANVTMWMVDFYPVVSF